VTASKPPTSAEELRGAGLRVTAVRVALLETVRGGDHLHVEGVAAGVRGRVGHVSLQAVYEALHALTAAGLIRRISRDGSGTTITTSCAGRAASSRTSTARSARPPASPRPTTSASLSVRPK
jgi:Fe2+ or Zn2+ uptake regulation protein